MSGAANPSGAGPFVATGVPVLAGQTATCAGPREKSFTLVAREATVDLGLGVRFVAWTYNGQLPGPPLEACEGGHVTITLTNHAGTSHGLDSHALRTDMAHFGPVAPDGTLKIEKTVDTPRHVHVSLRLWTGYRSAHQERTKWRDDRLSPQSAPEACA